MVKFFLLIFMLETFVIRRMKCTVAPESVTVISTTIMMLDALSIVSAFGFTGHYELTGGEWDDIFGGLVIFISVLSAVASNYCDVIIVILRN